MKKTTKTGAKNIGLDVTPPKEKCEDLNCPFHGKIKVRGRIFKGIVTKADMAKTISIEMKRQQYVPKYERYEKKKSVLKAHNPECISAKVGDQVTIAECKKISKTKSFVVVEKK